MKQSIKHTTNKHLVNSVFILKFIIVMSLLCTSFSTFAKSIARVTAKSGNAFLLNANTTTAIHVGDIIEDFSEVITDENGSLTFQDFHEHIFHLNEGSHVSFMNKSLELKGGNLWVQSENPETGYSIQSSNARISFSSDEFIISYNNYPAKTQVMVISGDVKFSNIHEEHLFYNITSGKFSFINQDFDKGLPRKPTLIGYDSYQQFVGTFTGVKPLNNSLNGLSSAKTKISSVSQKVEPKKVKRVIASAQEDTNAVNQAESMMENLDFNNKSSKRGVTFILTKSKVQRNIASAFPSGLDFYKNVEQKARKEKAKRTFKGATVPIRMFGKFTPHKKYQKAVKKKFVEPTLRVPSSIKVKSVKQISKVKRSGTEYSSFKNSLMKEYVKQKKHSKEVNQLIDELESYSNRYSKDF
jgi:hypothetical protein